MAIDNTGSSAANLGGDPMALVFVVQGIAVTGRLAGMGGSYSAFASTFDVFNLQMNAPAWSGAARVMATDAFRDDTRASARMLGNTFYTLCFFFVALVLHGVYLFTARFFGRTISGMYR